MLKLPALVRAATLWLLAATAGAAGAQPRDWTWSAGRVFRHTVAPNLEIGNAIVEDAAGFIWIGTQTGLLRWDGHRERDYFADPGIPRSLPDSFVNALFIDQSNVLWVGTNAGGLGRYDAITDSFDSVADPDGIVGPDVAAIAARRPRGLWIGGSRGLAWWDPATSRLVREPLPRQVGSVRSLAVARDGTLWLGSEHGLWARPANASEFSPVPLDDPAAGESIGILRLLEDRDGRIWVGTHLHGAFVVEPGATIATQVRGPADDDLTHDTVHAFVDAGDGEIWIGSYGGGVARFDTSTHRIVREQHEAARPCSLLDDSVGAMMRDRQGIVWISTGGGLSRYDTHADNVSTLFGGTGRSIRSNSVPAVMATPTGQVWVATGESGLQILDATGGTLELKPDPHHPETALPRARVIALANAPDGAVWIGTQGGLYHASADGTGLRRITIPGRVPTSETWAMLLQGSTLWVGGKDGLWAVDASNPDRIVVIRRLDDELGKAHVRTLALGRPGMLWVGTNEGVFELDSVQGEPRRLKVDPKDPRALPGGMVSSLLVDPSGRLWVGTFGQGIQVQTGQLPDGQPRFRRVTIKDGLPHNGVDSLLLDAQGQVWASTDDGLAQIDPGTLSIRPIRAAQGAGITVFWTGAATARPDGDLLFGGEGGLVVVRSGQLPPPASAISPPVVTEASVGGKPVTAAALAQVGEVLVPASSRRVQFEFASLSYSEQETLRYAYRLEGFEPDWTETDPTSRIASYTNLPPGRFSLQLRVRRPGGEWSEPRSIPLRVEPRWFERADVRLAGGALLLGLLAGLMQLRTAVLRRRQERLEALVAERTAELSRRTEELHRSQQQLEQLAYFDALTGLANRRLFNDELHRLIADAARGGEGFALVLIDLDHFKQINDSFGHDGGDAVLVATSQRLTETIRGSDRAARLGGDEFAVLLRARDDDYARLAAACTRIGERLAVPVESPAGQRLQVGASIGIARFPQDGDSAEALYKAADAALYEAKRAGRGQWRWAARPDSHGA